MKPRRILYVQAYNWDCGPHRVLRGLIARLDRSRFTPVVALPAPGDVAEEFIRLGAEVRFVPGVRTIPRSFSPFRQLRFWADVRSSAQEIRNLIGPENIALVHNNSEACWAGLIAARRARVPAVCHLHGMSVLSPAAAGWITTRALNRYAHALIACSGPVKRAYMKRGAREDLLKEIPNGVDMTVFDPRLAQPNLRRELGLEDAQPLVGMIANFDPRKGHHDFVAAAALVRQHFPNAHFAMVGDLRLNGDMDYFARIQGLVNKEGQAAAIHFLGFRRDVRDILASLGVVVQPSLTEAGPLVPLEAMAMERPVVATDVGGNSEEVIDGETGILVPAGDAKAIADAVVRLLSDAPRSHRMGKAGRERVLHLYTEEVCAQKIQQLYQSMLRAGVDPKDSPRDRTSLPDHEAMECKR